MTTWTTQTKALGLALTLVSVTFLASPAGGIANPTDPNERTLCAGKLTTVGTPLWAACTRTTIELSNASCAGDGDRYHCNVTVDPDVDLVIFAPGPRGAYAQLTVTSTPAPTEGGAGTTFGSDGLPASIHSSGPEGTFVFEEIPPKGVNATFEAETCIGPADPPGFECEAWTVGQVHLPGPSGNQASREA